MIKTCLSRLPGILTGALFAFTSSAGLAAVEDQAVNGFTVTETATIGAPADRVFQAVIVPSRWWSSEHTYSQNAANLALDARAGGCWCETLPGGGSVQHLVVVTVIPGKQLRLRGALGPLQGMGVDGAMTVSLRSTGNSTQLTLTYVVGGYSKAGFEELSKAVDSVLADQTARLKRFIETGAPETTPRPKEGQ